MSSIQAAKAGMSFQTATERPRCGNCRQHKLEYADRMPPYDRAGIRCKLGGFTVSSYAICARHEAERLPTPGPASQA